MKSMCCLDKWHSFQLFGCKCRFQVWIQQCIGGKCQWMWQTNNLRVKFGMRYLQWGRNHWCKQHRLQDHCIANNFEQACNKFLNLTRQKDPCIEGTVRKYSHWDSCQVVSHTNDLSSSSNQFGMLHKFHRHCTERRIEFLSHKSRSNSTRILKSKLYSYPKC